MKRQLYDDIHHSFRDVARRFIEREVVPFDAEWSEAGRVDKSMFKKAGEQGSARL